MSTAESVQAWKPSPSLPAPVRIAMDRVANAERELDAVYPLFATKLDAPAGSPSGSNAALELEAFVAEVRVAHHAALLALRQWSLGEGTSEIAARSYDALAILIERFARRAGLDAAELD